jgi:lysyl-tRNA synthetase class II
VFEINRNFRNEGISVRHNPEFTMMEFYAAYWNHHDLMDFTEQVLRHAARQATGSATLSYAGRPVDLDQPFARLTVTEALMKHAGLTPEQVPPEYGGTLEGFDYCWHLKQQLSFERAAQMPGVVEAIKPEAALW